MNAKRASTTGRRAFRAICEAVTHEALGDRIAAMQAMRLEAAKTGIERNWYPIINAIAKEYGIPVHFEADSVCTRCGRTRFEHERRAAMGERGHEYDD